MFFDADTQSVRNIARRECARDTQANLYAHIQISAHRMRESPAHPAHTSVASRTISRRIKTRRDKAASGRMSHAAKAFAPA
jgi:hypothetical protein